MEAGRVLRGTCSSGATVSSFLSAAAVCKPTTVFRLPSSLFAVTDGQSEVTIRA